MKIKKLLNLDDCRKCRECCKFKKGDEAWAPVFSKLETETISKNYRIKSAWKKYEPSQNSYQPRLVKSKKKAGLYVCPFLNENKYICAIEKDKPFDCRIWPFVLMRNRRKDAINLVYYRKDVCPGMADIGRRRFETYKNYLINFCKLNSIVPYLGSTWGFDSEAVRVCEIMKIPKGFAF